MRSVNYLTTKMIEIGYWKLRGLVGSIRLLLEFVPRGRVRGEQLARALALLVRRGLARRRATLALDDQIPPPRASFGEDHERHGESGWLARKTTRADRAPQSAIRIRTE